jgi:hypothetical protein
MNDFMTICPALVYELELKRCKPDLHEDHEDHDHAVAGVEKNVEDCAADPQSKNPDPLSFSL